MKCETCNDKGFVPDDRTKGATSGRPCLDCIDPVARRFLENGVVKRKPYLRSDTLWTIGKRTKGRAFHTPHRGRHTRGIG